MVDKLPFLSNELHYAITKVAVYTSKLEHLIEYTVSDALIDREETSKFLLKNFGTDRLVGLLRAVLLDACPADEKKVTELIAQIMKLRTERNEVLHWIWHGANAPDTANYSSYRPHRESQNRRKTAEEIDELSEEIQRTTTILNHWRTMVIRSNQRHSTPPFRDKPA